MNVQQLGYVGITSTDLSAWRAFGCEILGLMPDEALSNGSRLVLRGDERAQRIVVDLGPRDGFACTGWELADAAALDAAWAELEGAGVEVERGSDADCAARSVQALLRASDPAGNRIELFHGAALSEEAFVSPVPGQQFVTGALGLGHVVLPAAGFEECRDFYMNLLGFRVSDFLRSGPMQISFFHCNARHHSLALISADAPSGLWHMMLEVARLEDVVAAMDRLVASGARPRATLGRHTNDHMVSFYLTTPSGFDLEFGCQGIQVDAATWKVEEMSAPSFWGHEWSAQAGEV